MSKKTTTTAKNSNDRKPAVKRSEAPSTAPPPAKSRKVVYEWGPVSHSSHLKEPGQIFLTGDGDMGQLGRGEDIMTAPRPLISLDGTLVRMIVCGGMHTVVITEQGHVMSTGVNDEGALGRKTAGAAWEEHGAGLPGRTTDQYTWAPVVFPDTVKLPIVQLSAGDSHTVALDSEGQVFVWGTFRGDAGVFGFAPGQRLALLPTLVIKPTGAAAQILKITSGADHVLALQRDGTVVSWGTGLVGQLGRVGTRVAHPETTFLTPSPVPFARHRAKASHVVDIAAGSYASFAITSKGHIFGWGLNNYGQLGLPNMEPFFGPQLITSLEGKDITELQGGQYHTIAQTQGGELLSFGRSVYGRLGRLGGGVDPGKDDGRWEPAAVEGLDGSQVHGFAAGLAVSGCIAGPERSAYLWGFGTNNQLGKGDEDDSDEPRPAKLRETAKMKGRPILQISIGGQHLGLLAGKPVQQA